ncbi:hypothetical protein BT96DRAFT_997486 [Gymnopus androsaceus JB14]|uniref:Uncharacterized protein n=1 Tax=Gymnopus androsaceus JB14 TaxID=1447944 RepID=A0A6A4HF10_9AGAR|nr:hypothetical protein BT96DRAFT_997486 [Gymnopus androsaceus JB14]
MKYSLTTGAAAVALLGFAPSVLAATADEWRNRTVYQLVTDRFTLGNGSSSSCDTSSHDMGFNTIWISPIVQNVEGSMTEGEAYHGTSLHDRGMYLMVDVVVNHLVANPTNTTNSSAETFNYSLLQPFGSQIAEMVTQAQDQDDDDEEDLEGDETGNDGGDMEAPDRVEEDGKEQAEEAECFGFA